jgi:hypothetical protein
MSSQPFVNRKSVWISRNFKDCIILDAKGKDCRAQRKGGKYSGRISPTVAYWISRHIRYVPL